ncbi:MAG: MFS transporter [Planctomycetes bacterium]|nr:MFS transporter [Planctomycetota bacterium]
MTPSLMLEPPKVRPDERTLTLRRDLRAMIVDGAAFSVMVGVGETYLPAFVLALGKSELATGLVGTLPMIAGAVLQLVSPRAVARLRSFRRWVVLCALVQALSFVPLLVGALVGTMPTWLVFAVASVYWGAGMATGPAWNAWAESLVPATIRPRYFAFRTRAAQGGVFAGLVLGGIALQAGGATGHALIVFAGLFLTAMVARAVSAACLFRQSEGEAHAGDGADAFRLRAAARPTTGTSRRLLCYLVLMQVAVQICGPYFTAYMLRHLALSYGAYVVLLSSAFLTRVVLLPTLGTLARRWGPKPLLWAGACGIVPLPALWLVSDNFWWLLGVQIVGGAAWGAQELAMLLLFFETIPRHERTRVLTRFNAANALAMAGGTLVGAAVLGLVGEQRETYLLLFAVSAAARILPLAFLIGLPGRVAAVVPMALRILAVRPSAGSIDRPVLASLPDAPPKNDAA